MNRQGHHADLLGKLHDGVERSLGGLGLGHDLGDVVLPDVVGKVHGQIAVGTAGVASEGAGQQAGGVGDQHGLGGHKRRKLLVKVDLGFLLLGHRLHYHVCVLYGLGHIQL